MNNAYSKAYTEVLEILKYFPNDEYEKIPKEKIKFYKENMDKNYSFSINPEVDLSEQKISEETNSILVGLFRDYFASEKQKEVLNNLLEYNQKRLEEKKKEEHNTSNSSKKEEINEEIQKEQEENVEQELQEQTDLVVYKEPFFNRFIGFIKRLLRR